MDFKKRDTAPLKTKGGKPAETKREPAATKAPSAPAKPGPTVKK